jgi:hypothetical protein
MDKAKAAEWLLRRVVDRARASELVGDQLEAYPDAGGVRFWASISGLLLRFSWRSLLGMAASPVLGLTIAMAFFIFTNPDSTGNLGLSDMTVFHVKTYLLGMSVLLWMATAFSLIRLGWRDVLTGVGMVASVLWSASIAFLWQRPSATVLILLWAAFFVVCLSGAKRRRAFGILCSAVGVTWLAAFALSVFPHDPYSVFGKWQFLTAVLLAPILESRVTMGLYERLLGR